MAKKTVTIKFGFMRLFYLILCCLTSMIGYTIHHSIFWAIIDWLFMPFAWIKWLIYHECTLSVFQQTFSWFFN